MMISNYQSEVMKIYEKIREEETKALEERRKEISSRLPEVIDIEQKIGKLSIELSLSAFKDLENREERIKTLRAKITELRVQKSELLVQNGYQVNHLDMHYRCSKCKDTGFIITEKCGCYKQKLVQIYYNNSDLSELTKLNNFENFNFELYPSQRSSSENESPRKNIEKIVSRSISFVKNFETSGENLLFYGNSGTGKTFLSICIAKELLDKGFFVTYRTAESLMQNLKYIRFNNDSQLEDLLVNCDLLIIDDLGTEQISDLSMAEFFNLLNKKLLKGKKMIISTNCKLEEFFQIYSERIASRLLGSFKHCKFYGDDIRIKKNLDKAR